MVWIFRSSVFKCSLAIILINKDLWSYYFCYSFTYIINRMNVFITCVSLIHAIRNKNSPFFFLISFLFCFVFGEGRGGWRNNYHRTSILWIYIWEKKSLHGDGSTFNIPVLQGYTCWGWLYELHFLDALIRVLPVGRHHLLITYAL